MLSVLALAQARTNVDGSSCLFNCCCVSPMATVWLIRSAYKLPQHSMKVDCAFLCFVPCCYTNRLYQTTVRRGVPVQDGGATFNTNQMPPGLCPGCSFICLSALCGPCAMANAMDKYISMPWWRACLFVSPCAGDDFMDCCLPLCFPLMVMKQGKVLQEVEKRGVNSNRYLQRTMMHARMTLETELPAGQESPTHSPNGNRQKVSPVKTAPDSNGDYTGVVVN